MAVYRPKRKGEVSKRPVPSLESKLVPVETRGNPGHGSGTLYNLRARASARVKA
jgi:hypothetical protein